MLLRIKKYYNDIFNHDYKVTRFKDKILIELRIFYKT